MSERTQTDESARSSGSSRTSAYEVEARCLAHEPQAVGAQIFDEEWRVLKLVEVPMGVPGKINFDVGIPGDFLTYPAAEAIRWWFCAQLDQLGHASMLFETRIVRYSIQQSYAVHRTEEINAVGFQQLIKPGRA